MDPTHEAERLAQFAIAVRNSSLKRLCQVPQGQENWRPRHGLMSFADIAQHLIDADEWLFHKLRAPSLTGMVGRVGLKTVSSRADYDDLIDRLVQLGDERSRKIALLTHSDLIRQVPDDRFGGDVSVWWVIVRGNLDHEAHHRGQLALYLRLVAS